MKEKTQKSKAVFPADARINEYGFLHFRKAWLEDLGWTEGMALKMEKNSDGSVSVRKVQIEKVITKRKETH